MPRQVILQKRVVECFPFDLDQTLEVRLVDIHLDVEKVSPQSIADNSGVDPTVDIIGDEFTLQFQQKPTFLESFAQHLSLYQKKKSIRFGFALKSY